jgi:hypothetical protein
MGKYSPDWVREFAVLAFKQSKGNLGETTYSPDIHKVIEHCFARLKRKFQKWINGQQQQLKVQEYQAKILELLQVVCSAKQIAADVKSLKKKTMPAVIKAKGGYIPKSAR